MTRQFDAIVIGTGQSGPALAVRLAGEGLSTAIIERKRFGGTCVNTGCIPTKTLVASARAAYVARRAGEFGVVVSGDVRVDMQRVRARKDEIVSGSSDGVRDWLQGTDNLTVIEGHASFEGPQDLRVGDDRFQAPRIFIDVGGRPFIPDMPGIGEVPYLTNAGMLDLAELPDHLLVIGGSYIGLEFAQMFRRFGSKVTVVERGDRLIKRDDEDVSTAVLGILEAEGVAFELASNCIAAKKTPGGVAAVMDCADGKREVEGSHLLLAVGRRPNTDDLGLDQTGIETDKRGYIVVDDQLRTNVDGVWALGDVNGRGAFTHTSYNDYEIVAANLFDDDPRRVTDRILCYALYVDPPLGRVGVTEREVRKSGRPALMATMPMTRVGRARERSETQGFMKILVDAETKKILGAAILGIGGDEVIHLILDVMYADAPYTVIQHAVHIHPTVSELVPTLLGSLKPLS